MPPGTGPTDRRCRSPTGTRRAGHGGKSARRVVTRPRAIVTDMSEPIGQGLHHYVLPKDDPVAALNILRVIAEGRCEQPRTTKPRRTMVSNKRGRPGYSQAASTNYSWRQSMTRRWR
jgi:hypothetical protein